MRQLIDQLPGSKIREVANAGLGRADVLPFWFGESDEPTPAFIRDAAIRSLNDGETFYSHNLGLPALREALSGYVSSLHRPVGAERIAVTSSGVNALMLAMQALAGPGDEVIAVVPVWPNLTAQPAILGGEALIDGGVLNNLPGDVLRDRFGGRVVAVNVSPKEERQFAFAAFPSPWAAAMRFLGATPSEAPTILDIMTRAVTLTSARRARFVEREADYYLAPPIDGFGMLEFERIDELVEVGYRHAMEVLTPRRGELP